MGEPIVFVNATWFKIKNLSRASESYRMDTEEDPETGEGMDCAEDLTELTVDILRAASETFSGASASTYDALHPRHFALLSDKVLTVVGLLLELCEQLGDWPGGIQAVVTAL